MTTTGAILLIAWMFGALWFFIRRLQHAPLRPCWTFQGGHVWVRPLLAYGRDQSGRDWERHVCHRCRKERIVIKGGGR